MKQVIFHPVILASFENETVTDMVGTFRVLVVQLCFLILEYLNIVFRPTCAKSIAPNHIAFLLLALVR